MVVAAAMQPLVLDDAAQRLATRLNSAQASGSEPEAGVLAAADVHRLCAHVMLDDLKLGPAFHALMGNRRASGNERDQDGEGSLHPRNSFGARIAALERGAGLFGASGG